MFFYIYKLTRMHMFFSALSFVLSKVSFLIAMILPWKILAIASGSSATYFKYFNFFDDLPIKSQIAYLGLIVVSFFMIHLILEFAFDFLVSRGASRAIKENKKIGVFNNYRDFAKKIYTHYAVLFSAVIYSALVFVFLGFFYSSIIVNFVVYCFFTLILLLIFIRFFKVSVNYFSKWLSALYKTWWHLGFVFALIWVINDYWQGVMPGFLITFVSMLLYRQVLVMVTIIFNSWYFIYKDRVRVGQVFSPDPNSNFQYQAKISIDFKKLVENIENQKWLDDIYSKEFPSSGDFKIVKTCQLVELGNIAYITMVPQGEELFDGLLVKLYNTNREALAEQEVAILSSMKSDWPFIKLLDSKRVKGFMTLVCHWPAGSGWLQTAEKASSEAVIRKKLLACEPTENVIELYQRSQVGLLDRLRFISWRDLEAYSGVSASKIDWGTVQDDLEDILAEVSILPKQLSVTALAVRMVFGSINQPKLANVTQWAWEPLGSGWPLNRLNDLNGALADAAVERVALIDVNSERVNLVARIYEFEQRYRNKNYAGAANVLSILLKYYSDTSIKQSAS